MIVRLCFVVAIGISATSCREKKTIVPVAESPLLDADEIIDLGVVYLDGGESALHKNNSKSLELVRHKRYGMKCQCIHRSTSSLVAPALNFTIVQPGPNNRTLTIAAARLRQASSNESNDAVNYEGLVDRLNGTGKAAIQVRALGNVILNRDVTIRD